MTENDISQNSRRSRSALPHPVRRRGPAVIGLGLAVMLSACGTGPADIGKPGLYPVASYRGGEDFIWCVPYAREISGIQIRGDADTWWGQAAGRYPRGRTPAPYSVLALKPDNRLRDGHVAVVTGIVGPREIRVSHANWGWTPQTRGRVYEHMPVIDVSEANDWSEVRFKHPAVGDFGRVYPALGFIHSDRIVPDVRVAQADPSPRAAVSAKPAAPAPSPATSASAAMSRLF